MAPLTRQFEFTCHLSVESLEVPLGESGATLRTLAATCDSGIAYETQFLRIRRKWRTISVPERKLDFVHRDINRLLFPIDLALGGEANGYVTRRSTLTNAEPHVGATYLQKYDVSDFFDSVTAKMISSALVAVGFGQDAARLLASLTTCRGKLPLGARTSPRISNLVLWDFDEAMSKLAATQGLAYTRYADDLSFSGASRFDVRPTVELELRSRGFRLNESKSRSFKRGQPMFVTGLAVSDEIQPRVRKRFKRRLRQELFYIERYGLESHAATIDQDHGGLASRLRGQLFYLRSIEPLASRQLEGLYPTAYKALMPEHSDNRVERAERHRREFLEQVALQPPSSLPFYEPVIKLL